MDDDRAHDEEGAAASAPFQELGRFLLSRFALAYSTASVERCFSVCNYVKNRHRNRLITKTLDAIVRVRSYLTKQKVCCHDFPIIKSMLEKFNSSMYGSKLFIPVNSDICKFFPVIICAIRENSF